MKGLNEIIADNNRAANDELCKRKEVNSEERGPIHYSPFRAIYKPWTDLSNELNIGDTTELPNGTTLTCTWKPSTKD